MKSETISDIVREMRLHTRCSAADAFYDIVAWTKLCDRIEAAAKATIYTDNRETLRNALAENDRLRAAFEKVLELAGCLTNMSIIDYVHHKATHASLKYENGEFTKIEDPVAHQYQLLEKQMVPVFKMLKEAVADYNRVAKKCREGKE